MRKNRKANWGITHFLTPKLLPKQEVLWDKGEIPELPEKKKPNTLSPKNNFNPYKERSRKHRLLEERNTQIEKRNRMLYEKIQKIMKKGKTESKQKNSPEQTPQQQPQNNSFKPLSLPHVPAGMRLTKSELSNILDDRTGFAEKYFQELEEARNQLLKVQMKEIGNFECFGWKVKVMLMNHGEFIAVRGRKGRKKEVTKKYIYERVKNKVEKGLEEWVRNKFEFEV